MGGTASFGFVPVGCSGVGSGRGRYPPDPGRTAKSQESVTKQLLA